MHKTYSAVAVANTLIQITRQRTRRKRVPALRLHKLVYLAHGWSLALLDRPNTTAEQSDGSQAGRADKWLSERTRPPYDLPREHTSDLPPENHQGFLDSKVAMELMERHQMMVWPRMSEPGWNATRFNSPLANQVGQAWAVPINARHVGHGKTILAAILDSLEKAGIDPGVDLHLTSHTRPAGDQAPAARG